MTTYALTFGDRYRREPHPTFEQAHPDGWVEVQAAIREDAVRLGYELLGPAWSRVYRLDEIQREFFPRGCLGRLIDGELVPVSEAPTNGGREERRHGAD